jgi:hypothetical protein
LVQPIGLAALRPVNPDGVIIEPPEAVQARKDAGERRERALHFERRRLALAVLTGQFVALDDVAAETSKALAIADELIKQTGGVV